MDDRIGMGVMGLLMTAFFAYVLYCGFKDKCLSYHGVEFDRDEKPFFYWALMLMAGLMSLAGVAGIFGAVTGQL